MYYFEVIDSLLESYEDEQETLIGCLVYLYNNTTDKKLQKEAKNTCEELNRCVHCGGKLTVVEYTECHNELDIPCEEQHSMLMCKNCGREV